MRVVFISNYYNHHQSDFSEKMFNITDGNYFFIATQPMEQERKNMGWTVSEFPTFVKFQYESTEMKVQCQELIDNADIVIIGAAPDQLIKERLKVGKLTFRYWERPYRDNPKWYRLLYHTLKAWYNSGRFKNLYMLCASAYTASDCHKVHSFNNKCFKWGYFPKTNSYIDISTLLSHKTPASILWVARLIELKHPEKAILVAQKLKDQGIAFNLKLIGNGPLNDKLHSLIRELNLEDNVTLLGSMTPDEVRLHMEKSEIFLFTSDKNEGWGAVLNEAMNSGCAVISSHAIGSTPFLINDGVNGLIYKDDDLDDLFTKTKWLLQNPDKRTVLGKNAYNTIVNVWNAQIAADRLLQLAKSLQQGDESPFLDGPCSKAEIIFDNWK